jgi:hypothetical protein
MWGFSVSRVSGYPASAYTVNKASQPKGKGARGPVRDRTACDAMRRCDLTRRPCELMVSISRAHSRPRSPPSFSHSLQHKPCAAVSHEAFRKRRACRDAAPPVCACGGRPLVRGCVWRHRGARARDACVPPSVGVTEPTPPRGATPMSRSRLMPPGHRTARGGHTPERDVGPAGLPRSALQSRPMRG